MNYTYKKLAAMPYAQAHVEILEDGFKLLFSYVTLVAEISHDGWLRINGLYSMTTRKHISAFCKEYANTSYQTAKATYEDREVCNIYTGEIMKIEDFEEC